MKEIKNNKIKKQENILIYRLGSLGDTVIALPCFHKIKNSFPNAEISLLTNKPVMSKAAPLEAVLGKDYFYNRILHYPVGTRNPLVLFNLLKEIKRLKIDTVVNITALRSKQADQRDRLFFKFAGVKNFIGFDNTAADFTPSIDPKTGFYEWEAERLCRKIKKLGEVPLENVKYWDLKITESERKQAKAVLGNFADEGKIIAINIGTKMPVKDWSFKNWAHLIQSVDKKFDNWKLIIIGVQEEFELAEKIKKFWKGEALNLCGKTSPRVSAEILKYADIFVGHDSGPLHLAACVGTPCVGIYSGLNKPRQWFPRGENNTIIFPKGLCENCKASDCISINNLCILNIDVAEVENAVFQIMEKIPDSIGTKNSTLK